MKTSLEGEKAPDMSNQELNRLKKTTKKAASRGQTATPKTVVAKTRAKQKRVASAKQLPAGRDLSALAQQVKAEIGWDSRITIYVDDKATLKEYEASELLSRQYSQVYEIGGAKVQEIGAWRGSEKVQRIVKVTWN